MVALKTLVRNSLDRPGGRWLLALRGTALVSIRTGRLCRVGYDGHAWTHRHGDGVLVHKTMVSLPPATFSAVTRDVCCYAHAPQPGDSIVDVGVGGGIHTLAMARMVGGSGRVVGIDADARQIARLDRMIELNRLPQVQTVHAAATADPARRGGLAMAGDAPAHRTQDLLPDAAWRRVDLLHVRVGGAELDVLRGMGDALAAVQNIAVACHDYRAESTHDDTWRTRKNVAALLRRQGFVISTRPHDARPYVRSYLYASRRDDR